MPEEVVGVEQLLHRHVAIGPRPRIGLRNRASWTTQCGRRRGCGRSARPASSAFGAGPDVVVARSHGGYVASGWLMILRSCVGLERAVALLTISRVHTR